MFETEKIYIAGPECFYTNGREQLRAMRLHAESLGFGVTLPNDHPLDMENPDLRKRADSIFQDLKTIMKETTVIIADLEAYRGAEPDSGTVYELGMAYADGLRCYGYTRDKRALCWKDQSYVLKDGVVCDGTGKRAPYPDLPFSPAIVGSTKIIEGNFDDCLAQLRIDLEEEWKQMGRGVQKTAAPARTNGASVSGKPRIYLADLVRYEEDADVQYGIMKDICQSYGLEAVTPIDCAEGIRELDSKNPYVRAGALAENYCRLIAGCDAVLADLNHYRGYECANDVGFECGVGFEFGKQLFGYMADTRPCIEKIPNYGEAAGYRDFTGCNVENFNYPINLMFASSMEIWQADFEAAVKKAAEQLKAKTKS